jgi:hypothetical protein
MAGAIKNHLYKYVAENEKVTNGPEFLIAVSKYNGIKAASFYHCSISNEEEHKGDATVKGIFHFYEFIFEGNSIKIKTWNFYEIGTGATAMRHFCLLVAKQPKSFGQNPLVKVLKVESPYFQQNFSQFKIFGLFPHSRSLRATPLKIRFF